MRNIPVYDKYNGEKRIALLDNSTIAFMHELHNKGINSENLLQDYDCIFLPDWVAEEVRDSEFRVKYIEQLVCMGIPIFIIKENTYSELMDGQELYLYHIVKAAVSKLGIFLKYMRQNVEKDDPLDMEPYEEWIQKMYVNWPLLGEHTSNRRIKKKNAGEISLTILTEIFSWHYPDIEVLTVYTQDTVSYAFQKHAEDKLKKIFKNESPVSVTYRSNDAILCQLYRNAQLSLKEIEDIRKDTRTVTYTLERADKTIVLETKKLDNEAFIKLIQNDSAQIIF